jgi:hypothetical protein
MRISFITGFSSLCRIIREKERDDIGSSATEKNRHVMLPPEAIRALKLKAGELVDVSIDSVGRVTLTRPAEARIAAIRGSLKVSEVPIAVEGRETFETGVARDNS